MPNLSGPHEAFTIPDIEDEARVVAHIFKANPALTEGNMSDVLDALHASYARGRSSMYDGLLSAGEMATAAGISLAMVHKMASKHGIGKRVGRDWVFNTDQIAFFKNREWNVDGEAG